MGSKNDNSSEILKLQILENEFNLVMKQYEEAHLNYISSLQAQGSLNDKNKFVSLNGRTFWGTSGLKEGNVDSEDSCKALCSTDSSCTGATYNSEKAYCWTRTGKGDVSVGLNTDYALIPDLAQNVNNIQQLNNKLTDLNKKIEVVLNNIVPEQQQQVNEKNAQKNSLQKIYQQLLDDRINIDAMIKEYNTINEQYKDDTIYVEQTNSAYILWVIFTIIVIIFTIKFLFFPNAQSNSIKFIFWFVIIILFLIVTMYINNASYFLLWGLIILLVFFIQMKIIPSP